MMTSKYTLMLAWLVCCWTGIVGQILSRNRTVYMSSQYSDWSGDKVVDGNKITEADSCKCCAATTPQTDPWITIDLGNTYLITRIRVYGRTDNTNQNLNGLVFKLDDTPFTPTTDRSTSTLSYTFILDQPNVARNVTLLLPGSNRILALCEFDVFNDNVISTNKSINASSQYSSSQWPIKGAVDGNTRTDAPNSCQCCAATEPDDNPWMYVNLGGYFYITSIIIYGRTDSNPDDQRFHGLQIEAGNGSIINVPDTVNYYESGAMRVGPATYIKLQINGNKKYLVVCELQVFGVCADGYTQTDISCQTVCPGRTYGTNCSETCGQCRNEANCNPTDGVCQQCEDGFSEMDKTCKTLCPGGTYGKNCTDTCGYCRNGLNCSHTNGTCEICEDGYTDTEPTCQTPCSGGTFGTNCSETCGHCRNGTTCNRTIGACEGCADGFNETDITCKTPCPGGTYGYNCTENCGHCKEGLDCNKTDGVCEQCDDGFDELDRTCKTPCVNGTYGPNCTGLCGHCENGAICDKTHGVCDHCEDGYMATDMLCIQLCPNGTYGSNCSEKCGKCIDGASCNQTNGNCGECERGYTETDTTCKTPCADGTYGHNCTVVCGHCKIVASCNKTDGVCNQCEDGYMETDMLCVEPCVDGTYGHNCTGVCGHCKNGTLCNKMNGLCDQCEDGYMETDMLCVEEALQDEEGRIYVGAISGTVVGVIVLACLAIGAIMLKRRRYGKEKSQQKYQHEPIDLKDEGHDRGQQNPDFDAVCPEEVKESGTYYNLVPKTQDIPVSKLWSYVYETRKNGSETLIKQYKDIGEHISPTKEAMAYRYKIRYKDMLPYDHTRVHLDVQEEGECEFINASHIHGFDRQNKFIASQGPMDVMVDDFWRMVWQQDSKKIVMLTNVKEKGSMKCIQYWPELEEEITQGRIQITLVKEEMTTDYVIRTLELKQDQSRPRVIQQFHYKAWPDKDVPDSTWSLVLFWREVFKENDSSTGPIIVHCSAGVGRTGTFIALDNLFHQALQTGTINPFEIVSSLRTQRLKMVQTQMQYIYLHDAVAESLSIGTHYIWQTQFESYYNYMVKLDMGASQTRLQNQYQLMLDGMKHMKKAMKGGASEEHIYSDSEINEYRPKAQIGSTYEDVFSGKTLSNYAGKKCFMIMTLPNKKEIHLFWNLLESRNIKTVVTLTYDDDPSAKLWSSRSSTKQGNSSTNSPILVNEDKKEGLCIRTYELTKDTKPSNKVKGVVKHFELTTAKSSFPNRDTMVKVLHEVLLCHQYLSESEQILIQCRDGEGRSGIMCVLLNEVARMKGEGHIHILESVTLMKNQVPGIIPNFEQYKYIHDVILGMVKTKDVPADVNAVEDESIYENVATDKL